MLPYLSDSQKSLKQMWRFLRKGHWLSGKLSRQKATAVWMITIYVPCLRPSVSTNKPFCTQREIERKQSIKIQKSQALSVKILFPEREIFTYKYCKGKYLLDIFKYIYFMNHTYSFVIQHPLFNLHTSWIFN